MKPISIISQDLFDKVRSRFSNLEMGDETGAVIIDPEEARFFDFDFVYEGNNLGRVSISINDPGSLKVYFSQGITENQDGPVKKHWFNFLREMRFFAMRRLLRFDTRDIAKTNLDKNDFQHLAKTQAPKGLDMTTTNENKNIKNGNVKHKPLAEDHEIQMANSELQSIGKNAEDLLQLVQRYSEEQGLEAWQQSKITKAADYLNSVLQSINGEQSEQGVAEGEKTMSRAAKGYEKYGKKGMMALAKAGREGASEKKLDAIRDKHDNYNESAVAELQEGRWNNKSSRKTSRAVTGKTEVIVRHARPVDEEYSGSRSQRKNIKAIYIQNADGERFKYPFIHTAGAFAMAQHVDHGGAPHDPAGQAIVKMSEEIAQLSEFQRKIHRATLHQDASGITERAIGRMNELKSQIAALGKRQHYQNWMETFNSDSMMNPSMEVLDDVTMEQYKQKFTQTNFQEELSAYFPLLHKIMSETNKIDLDEYVKESEDDFGENFDIGMGQASHGKGHPDEEFAEWAEAVEQGKLTSDQIAELKQAISELPQGKTGPELELGPNGSTAIEFFQGLGLNDSDLRDKLKDMANVDSESDALEVFKIWSNENYPELAVSLGISDTDTGTEEPTSDEQPEPETAEQPTAENEEQVGFPNKTMPTREAVIKEVAKLVKSRYNEDNPDVGPFNGAPNIALDVKKKCAEMFGEQVGDQAEHLAMDFMEKLSKRWEEKHGSVGDDGLARLKELLGNVKTKVEGIGDITNNGHAPGNNIMPAEEGIGTKILGGAALIAALWGVNNHLANQAYEASPQLQKLTQYYKQAEAQNDTAKMRELEQRIENHKARLDLGHGDVMDKTGNPKEVVPEMADILKLSGLAK
jgi:hypothetical protein